MTGIICIALQTRATFWPGFIAKVLLMPILMVLLFANLEISKNRLNFFFLAGLVFSWVGDIVLEFSAGFFILGLVSFLLAHVMYLTVFFFTPGKNTPVRKWYVLIPVILSGAVLIAYLYPGLGEMRLPVFIYTAVILTMLTGAINRKEKANSVSYYLILAGAILFVISDSAIAIDRFRHHFYFSGIIIMSTYVLAQYLIVTGYIFQFRSADQSQISR
jgi:uncharacterized membrane protein YhhN